MWRSVLGVLCILPAVGCFDPVVYLDDFVFDLGRSDDCDELALQLPDQPEIVPQTPDDLGLEFEDFSVEVSEGQTVAGWFMHAAVLPARGTVMMSNASKGTRACHLAWTHWLVADGYNVVMYDYEGFGDSEGEKSLLNTVPDAEAVLEWTLDSDDPARQSVALMGVSLGTGPSIWLAAEFADRVWAVVLDSPFTVPRITDTLNLGPLVQLFLPDILAIFPDEMDNSANIPRVSSPLMILVGGHDRAFATTFELFSRAGNGSVFSEFANSSHAQALFDEPDNYQQQVLAFLGENAPRR